jgi:hypothetical protein
MEKGMKKNLRGLEKIHSQANREKNTLPVPCEFSVLVWFRKDRGYYLLPPNGSKIACKIKGHVAKRNLIGNLTTFSSL